MKEKSVITIKTIKFIPFIITVFFALFMFSDPLEIYVSGAFGYLDELAAILLGLYFVYYAFTNKIKIYDIKIIITVIAIWFIGFLGNQFSSLNISELCQIFDAFNIFKFILAFLGGHYLFSKIKDKSVILFYLTLLIKITIVISTVFMIINLFTDIGMYTDYRYGLRTYNFIFSRVGEFYSACLLWLIVITANFHYNKKSLSDIIAIVLILINMCSTLRTRAFAFAILYVMLYFTYIIRKNGKIKPIYFVATIIILFFLSDDQLTKYYTNETARYALFKYGFVTAKNYFPLGSGFATYGTAIAQQYYSPLYYTYNFSKYWGLGSDFSAFLTDNYWPAVMGEFGFFGLILMAVLLISVIKHSISFTDNKYSKLCVVFGFASLLVSSIASSSFFACTRILVFMLFIACNSTTKSEKEHLINEHNYGIHTNL